MVEKHVDLSDVSAEVGLPEAQVPESKAGRRASGVTKLRHPTALCVFLIPAHANTKEVAGVG